MTPKGFEKAPKGRYEISHLRRSALSNRFNHDLTVVAIE